MGQDLFADSWRSRLDRLTAGVRTLHKALIDSTQRDYEKIHGRIASPYALFALVAHDPAFAWLQPMTRLIVELEDRLGMSGPPVGSGDLDRAGRSVRDLLEKEGGGFAAAYRERIQRDPRVAAEHGVLQPLIPR